MSLETIEAGSGLVAQHALVAGIDEVGRGAWAGPVCVGVALVDPGSVPADRILVGADGSPHRIVDSKILSQSAREAAFPVLAGFCSSWGVGFATNKECDSLGMTAAQRLAAQRAFEIAAEMTVQAPGVLLLDGIHDYLGPRCSMPQRWRRGGAPQVVTIPKGEAQSFAIAAASVLAKVTRDRHMIDVHRDHPEYGFASNKGYPAPVHLKALGQLGLTPIHRSSWSYVESMGLGGKQHRFQFGMCQD